MRFGCYFMGASGVGKSTLADAVSKDLGLPKVPSVARATMKELGLGDDDESFQRLLKDRKSYGEFQKALCLRQKAEEEKHQQFVADRGCDHLAYSSLYTDVVREVYEWPDMKAYLDKLANRTPDFRACVFLVRPTPECHEAALQEGKRSPFLIWEDMLRIDGMIEMILKINGIRYVPISSPDFRDRIYTATAVASLAMPVVPESKPVRLKIPPFPFGNKLALYGVMQRWLKDNECSANELQLGNLPEGCPLRNARNDDAQDVLEKLIEEGS